MKVLPTIRTALVADVTAIAMVIANAWQRDFVDLIATKHHEFFTEQWFEKRTLADIKHPDTVTWLVEVNSRIVGYSCVRHHTDTGELVGLYLHPQYQGQGLGKHLFQHACAELIKANKKTMIVWTFNGANNNHFYRHMLPLDIRYREITIQATQYAGIGFVYSLDAGRHHAIGTA